MIFISFVILQTVNFPSLALVLISYFALIVLPRITLLAVGHASVILCVYKIIKFVVVVVRTTLHDPITHSDSETVNLGMTLVHTIF